MNLPIYRKFSMKQQLIYCNSVKKQNISRNWWYSRTIGDQKNATQNFYTLLLTKLRLMGCIFFHFPGDRVKIIATNFGCCGTFTLNGNRYNMLPMSTIAMPVETWREVNIILPLCAKPTLYNNSGLFRAIKRSHCWWWNISIMLVFFFF